MRILNELMLLMQLQSADTSGMEPMEGLSLLRWTVAVNSLMGTTAEQCLFE